MPAPLVLTRILQVLEIVQIAQPLHGPPMSHNRLLANVKIALTSQDPQEAAVQSRAVYV